MYPGVCSRIKGYTVDKQPKIDNQVQEFVQIFKSLPDLMSDYEKVLDARRLEEAGLSLPRPMLGPSGPADKPDMYEEHIGYIRKRKREIACSKADYGPDATYAEYISKMQQEIACSMADSDKMEGSTKRGKSLSQLKGKASVSSAPVKSKNVDVAQEELEEEEDPEEELASTRTQEMPAEDEEDPEEEEDLVSARTHEMPAEEEDEVASTRTQDMSAEDEEDPEEDEEEASTIPEERLDKEKEPKMKEVASTRTQERPTVDAPINSVCVEGEKEVSQQLNVPTIGVHPEGGKFPSFPHSGGTTSIGTLLTLPEVSTALGRLPEIFLAAQRSEAIERELNESRQENMELKREKVELESQNDELRRRERQLLEKEGELQLRIERAELDKKTSAQELLETQSKLGQTAQKAKELFEISSPLLSKLKLLNSRME